MVTGDHPGTALAIAARGRLWRWPTALVLEGGELPDDDAELGALLDRDGVVVARVTPEDKLRIARALRARGHVVAMTGDGVNDGPALRDADIGIAMGASGTDVAREAADLVLLDDHFATIVAAVELGRATYANIRRFLTYHLTDNVAELAPFVVWALSGGRFPLAHRPCCRCSRSTSAPTCCPPSPWAPSRPSHGPCTGRPQCARLIDRRGAAAGLRGARPDRRPGCRMTAFVLGAARWAAGAGARYRARHCWATASGTAFAAIVARPARQRLRLPQRDPPVVGTGVRAGTRCCWGRSRVELALLLVFLGVPPLADLLGRWVADYPGSGPAP